MIAVVSDPVRAARPDICVGEGSRPAWGTTDPAVVVAAQQGCKRSFSTLYAHLGERVRLTAVRILRDDHAAEDMVQETFLAVLEGLPRLADPLSFETWLMRIARNKAISAARRRDRLAPSAFAHGDDLRLGANGPAIVSRWGTEEPRPLTVLLVRTTYRDLPHKIRGTMRLRYIEGLTCAEIAARLEVSVVCVKTRLHRGRSALYSAARASRT
jgi:RNA polymerase sigma-70 factor (ECF subfamily)